jgi:phage-related protein
MGSKHLETSRWRVVFYEDHAGCKPVKDFLDALPTPDRVSVTRNMKLLEEFGLDVGAPIVRPVSDRRKLWELRIKATSGAIRIFYFAHTSQCFVMLHGFIKKSRKTPPRELDIAENRMHDILNREKQK